MALYDIRLLVEQANGTFLEKVINPFFGLSFNHGSHNPTLATGTYYMAYPSDLAPVSAANPELRAFKFPYPILIKAAVVNVNVGGTLSSAQSGTSAVNLYNVDTTGVIPLVSGLTYDSQVQIFSNASLDIAITNVNMAFTIQVITPTFVGSAPTSVRRQVNLYAQPI